MDKKINSREERKRLEEQQRKANRKRPTNSTKKKPTKKAPKKSIIKRIFKAILLLILLGFIAGGAIFAYFAITAPDLDEDLLKDPVSSKFYDINGDEFYEMGTQKRENVDYEDIPKEMEDAILSTEDSRFYSHHGIDFYRLGGAVIANVRDGFGAQGASTITQQVIKNSFFDNGKTLKRKVQEAYLSLQLEREYSKEEIFEMYFNKVLMSGRIYGFGTAAEYFYGKELKDLTLDEMAVLAGMPQAPNGYNPFTNPERAEKRRNLVLQLMYNNNKITKEEMEDAQAVDLKKGLLPEAERVAQAETKYDAFIDTVLKELADNGDEKAIEEGISVYTTLDPKAQQAVERTINNAANFPTQQMQAGVAVVNTETGAIAAVGGGRDYGVERGFNYATASNRQPGSTMKPLMDYGPAIENLQWSTGKILVDEPTTYTGSSQQINNFDRQYKGSVTMRYGLYNSRNVPAMKTFREVGAGNAKKFVNKLGIEADTVQEADAIGGGSITLSPIQMAASYAAFGNNGIYTEPYAIKKIVYRDGKTSKSYTPDPVSAMQDYTAYMVTDMLRDVISTKSGASGSLAIMPGIDAAGKSGTTNYSADEFSKYNLVNGSVPDIWFAGYTTKYSMSVWTGYADRSNAIQTTTEKQVAQRIFKSVMSDISQGASSFKKPASVVEKGGELFVRSASVAPTQTAEKEEKVKVDAPTGLSASYNAGSGSVALSWGASATSDVEYIVSVGGKKITTTAGTSATYKVPDGATTLTFAVVAVAGNSKSKAATATVTISTPAVEEPEIEEPEEELPEEDVDEPTEQTEPEEEPAVEEPSTPNTNDEDSSSNNGTPSNEDNEQDDNNASTPPTRPQIEDDQPEIEEPEVDEPQDDLSPNSADDDQSDETPAE